MDLLHGQQGQNRTPKKRYRDRGGAAGGAGDGVRVDHLDNSILRRGSLTSLPTLYQVIYCGEAVPGGIVAHYPCQKHHNCNTHIGRTRRPPRYIRPSIRNVRIPRIHAPCDHPRYKPIATHNKQSIIARIKYDFVSPGIPK